MAKVGATPASVVLNLRKTYVLRPQMVAATSGGSVVPTQGQLWPRGNSPRGNG